MSTKKFGLYTLISLVMGNMIGAGVFTLPTALGKYGAIGIVGWGVTAIGSILIALVFANLSRRLPLAGGPYAYCRQGFGSFMGFQVAWTYWISMWVGSVAVPVAAVGYLSFFFPALHHEPLIRFLICLGIIWGLTAVNLRGVKTAGLIQIITTILKILPVAAVILFGFSHLNMDHFSQFNLSTEPTGSAILSTAVLTMWSFLGLESGTVPADSIQNPRRTIPLATLIGVISVAAIFILSYIAIVGVVPAEVLKNSPAPFAVAAEMIFGSYGGIVIAVGAIIASLGSLNGFILIQSRVPMAAAQDGLFFKNFGKTLPDGTPAYALKMTAVLMSLVMMVSYNTSLVQQFEFIINLATLMALLTFSFSVLADILITFQQDHAIQWKKAISSIATAIGAWIYILWMIIGAEKVYIGWLALIFFAGAPFYIWIQYCEHRKDLNVT